MAEVSDNLEFTQTRLTERTMKFTHDSSRGSSETPAAPRSTTAGKRWIGKEAECHVHRFPFPRASVGCEVRRSREKYLPAAISSACKHNALRWQAGLMDEVNGHSRLYWGLCTACPLIVTWPFHPQHEHTHTHTNKGSGNTGGSFPHTWK